MTNKTLKDLSPGLVKYLSVKLNDFELIELQSIFNNLIQNSNLEELKMPFRESNDYNPRAARILNILFTDYETADFKTFKAALHSCDTSASGSSITNDPVRVFESSNLIPQPNEMLAVCAARLLDDIRHLHLMEDFQTRFKILNAKAEIIIEVLNKHPEFNILNRKIKSAILAQSRKLTSA
jgi:hypothetical protein